MMQEPKANRRIVSRSAYVWAVAKSMGIIVAGMMAFIGFFAGVIFLVLRTLQYGKIHGIGVVLASLCCFVVVGLFFNCDAWFHSIFKKAESIDIGIPLTRTNVADLPANEILVRVSEEPMQAQDDVLLRAAAESTQPQDEGQLLRASVKGE